MRVLRLELGNELGTIDLHPFVTVLQGVDAAGAERVIDAVRALAEGREPGVGGLVENEGLLIELVPGERGPGGGPCPGHLDPEDEPPRGDVALDVDHLPIDAPDQLPALWARCDQLGRAADIDAARVEEARTQLDPTAAIRLARLEADRSTGPSIDPAGRAAVQAALAAWSATPETVLVAAPWVVELSRQWDDHLRRGAACEARLAALTNRVADASRRLASAVAALDEAEAAAVPVLLGPEEENRLAELATRPAARGLLRGAKGRSDEDQSEIDELLARVGQPTYAAYVMFRMAPTPPAGQLAAVEAARTAVAQAEQQLAAATRERDEDPDLAAHRQRRDALRAVAAERLGPLLPDDLQQVLSGHGEHRPNPERAAARRALVAVAASHGAPCPETADDAELAELLERWLAPAADEGGGGPTVDDVAALQRRVARHHQALAAIDRLERRADHSRRLVTEVEERIAAVGRPPAPSVGAIVAALDRLAVELGVGRGRRSVPLVLAGSFRDLPDASVAELLDRLELEAERVQLIVVSDRVEAGRWADEAGMRRALRTRVPAGRK